MTIRLKRRQAVSVMACAVLGASVGLEASTANAAVMRATSAVLPAGALPAMQAAFSADSSAQLNAGLGVSGTTGLTNLAATGAGTRNIGTIATRDADVAAYTELEGGPVWDSATTTLSNANVTGVTDSTITVSADVTQIFHIEGTSTASFADSPLSYTGVDNPYTVTLSDASGSWQIASLAQTPTPGEPAPVSGSAAQIRGREALTRWHRRTPHFRVYRERVMATAAYNGDSAYAYALTWWNSPVVGYNPAFAHYPDDCMNFASQIINAAGEPTGSVWYPGSASWINTSEFYDSERQWYTPDNYEVHYSNTSNSDVNEGDLIGWTWGSDWSGPDHETYVMGFNGGNVFDVASHTNPRWNYPSTSEFAYGGTGTFFRIERPNGS